jgi:hypothetical protein
MLVGLAAATISTDQREEWRKKGVTLPDGSYPIPNVQFLRKAMQSFGRCPPSKREALRRHIQKRARELGVDISDSAIVAASAAGISNVDFAILSLAIGDDDDDPTTLALALDAVTDAATDLVATIDTTQLPPAVQQALALLEAADSMSDALLDALGIPDPDEDEEDEGPSGWSMSKVGLAFGGKKAPPFGKGNTSDDRDNNVDMGATPTHSADDMGDDEKNDIKDLHPMLKKKYHLLRDKGKSHGDAMKGL